MRPYGGFDHNAQSLKAVTVLEQRYAAFDGLNLTWETLEGLAKHNGPVARPLPWALAAANAQWDLALGTWPSLEAQVAAIADDIAYDNHDIDDGLRSGLFTLEELLEVPLAARMWAGVKARYPDIPNARLTAELVRDQIGLMVNDVLEETQRRASGLAGIDAVRAAGRPLAGFSEGLAAEERALKTFLHARMYNAPPVAAVRGEAQKIVAGLWSAYAADPSLLPAGWRPVGGDRIATLRAIGDFIAGMTDRYAIRQYRDVVGPVELPEGF
jgi:dGTPase